MAWYILTCVTLLAVHGLISESGANILKSSNVEANQNFIELYKRDSPVGADNGNKKDPIDIVLRNLLSKDKLPMWKYTTNPIIYNILTKMVSYYEKDTHASLSEMLQGLLCQLRQMQYFGGTSTKTLTDIIENIGTKPTCSTKQQTELLEKIVKMSSLDYQLNPKNIFDFLQSDIFKIYAKLIGIRDNKIADIISAVAVVDKLDVVNWTWFNAGKRFLCHLTVTNYYDINWDDIRNTIKQMTSEPKCSENDLKKKWEELVTSFSNQLKPLTLPIIESAANDINQWPVHIMKAMKTQNWKAIKEKSVNMIKTIDGFISQIFSNVQKSSPRDWSIKDLLKNFICGLNVTDFSKLDMDAWISRIGNLDVCDKKQEEKGLDHFLDAMAMLYVKITIDLNESIGNIRKIFKYVKDSDIQVIQYLVRITTGMKELDTLIGTVWQNTKDHPNENLNLDYILKFLSCNIKEKEIKTINLDKFIKIVSTFGRPLPCKLQDSWRKDILKLLWKHDFEMGFQQLDKLDAQIGGFTTEDLKSYVKEAEKLKNSTMATLNKLSERADGWITYIEQEDAVLNMSTIATQVICFISKADFSTLDKSIISFGDIGACTESESTQFTEGFLKKLTQLNLGELKEFLIAFGIFTGEIDIAKMKDLATKLIMDIHKYTLQIGAMIPQEVKDLTLNKVLTLIRRQIEPLDEFHMCVTKVVLWQEYDQPGGPTLMYCLGQKTDVPDDSNGVGSVSPVTHRIVLLSIGGAASLLNTMVIR